MNRFRLSPRRAARAFTLIEMLVVITVLAILVGLVIPRIVGVAGQATAATDANILAGIDRGVAIFEARFGKYPNGWDGILSAPNGSFYSKMNPALNNAFQIGANGTTTGPVLTTITLDAVQAKSLNDAGIAGIHYNAEGFTGLPSDSGQSYSNVQAGISMAALVKTYSGFGTPNAASGTASVAFTGHGNEFPDRAFGLNPFRPANANEFVVLGVGAGCSLKGNGIQDKPIIQAADPEKYYANVLCVFMVPKAGGTYFKAQYIGCFAPDGTCVRDNVNNYITSGQSPN
jgi:prepilin-type N-terminal cleavage/methylation domain-containing protein